MTIYRHHGLVLVRAGTDPGGMNPPENLDPTGTDPAAIEVAVDWVRGLWARTEVRDALRAASPSLGHALARLVADAHPPPSPRGVRRVVCSVASYVLRWQRRATPFGLFAGITTAGIGPAHAEFGPAHRVLLRADAEWLSALLHDLESDPHLRRRLHLLAANDRIERDGRLLVLRRAAIGAAQPGAPRWSSVRATRPARAALAAARTATPFTAIAEELGAAFPTAASGQIHDVLHALIDAGLLITDLHAGMTEPDPLSRLQNVLQRTLREAPPEELRPAREVLREVTLIQDLLCEHHRVADTGQARALRAQVHTRMARLLPHAAAVSTSDTHLDARITVPQSVLREAARAAEVLLRTGTSPFGTRAWRDYHSRFRARYGPAALVAVTDLVSDAGLGYPSGYLGAPPAPPSWRALSERDAVLLARIQRAGLNHEDEIQLSDTDITALATGDPGDIVPPRRVEIGVAVHAPSTTALDDGTFQLRVLAAPRPCTTMTGRFAHLLPEHQRAHLSSTFTTDSVTTENSAGQDTGAVLAVQVSFPARRPHNDNVVRVPPLLPLVHLGEHPGTTDGQNIELKDLAVTADSTRMVLVHRPSGRAVTAYFGHALDTLAQAPPLARFLAELSDARSAVYRGFDLGAARTLPWVPRIRYRRSVLHPARWLLHADDLTAFPGTTQEQLRAWATAWRVPHRVVLVHGELRLPLRLDQAPERALLLHHLGKHERVEIHDDGPADADEWLGRPAELLIPLTTDLAAAPPPDTSPAEDPEPPGSASVLHAQISGNPACFDAVLGHVPTLITALDGLLAGWWISRYRDLTHPDTDQHVSIHLRLRDPADYGAAAMQLGEFATALTQRGLPDTLTLAPAARHPGRYGTGPLRRAAEAVFTADSTAALTQLTTAGSGALPGQALAAASLAHLAAAFAPDPTTGYRALLRAVPQRHGRQDRDLVQHTLRAHATTAEDNHPLAAAWAARTNALAAYYEALRTAGRDPAELLTVLLHEHHVRALGVDPDTEAATHRLARACALRHLARP